VWSNQSGARDECATGGAYAYTRANPRLKDVAEF